MNKVYWKNCEHFNSPRTCYAQRSDVFTIYVIDHRGYKVKNWRNKELFRKLFKIKAEKELPYWNEDDLDCSLNEKYTCPIYERQWYKFWLPNPKIDLEKLGLEAL